MMGLPPINTKTPMPPPMTVNMSDEELDWRSDGDVAESAYQAGAIQIDQWEKLTGDHSVFDNHYDPRQVIFSQSDVIHANQYPQYDSHVAYNVCKHVISVDTSKINRNLLANCVKCKENKLVQFIADTGASNTFTFDKSDFTTFIKDKGNIQTADKKVVLQIQGYGTVFIKHEISVNGKVKTVTSKLQLVYYAPEISYRLLSISSLLQRGYILHGEKDEISIRKPDNDTVLAFHPHAQNPNIYWLNAKIVKDEQSLSNLVLSAHGYDLWHECLGHPSQDVLRQVSRNTTGMPSNVPIPKEIPICRGCSQGKMTSSSFPESTTWATAPFSLIHMDLKTIPVLSYHKYKYIITFLDDHTSHGWITLLKNKSDAYKAIDHFIAMVETQYNSRVWAFMFNFGGEFTFLELEERLKELGIRVQQSVPHMPQQNGHAEHFNRTLFEKAEAMRHQVCLPKSWWEFCVEYSIHVYNRMPIICLKHKTPYEAINRLKPEISHLRILGGGAYICLPT